MYSVVYPGSDFGKFSGMVPEWFRNGSEMVPESNFGGFSGKVPEWFRKRSIIRSWEVPQSFFLFIAANFLLFRVAIF